LDSLRSPIGLGSAGARGPFLSQLPKSRGLESTPSGDREGGPYESSRSAREEVHGPWLEYLVSKIGAKMRPSRLTWVGNADADVSALELSLAESKSLLQAVDGTELDIAETLGSAVHLVLNNANAGNLASVEEIADIGLGDFERKVAKVGGAACEPVSGLKCAYRLTAEATSRGVIAGGGSGAGGGTPAAGRSVGGRSFGIASGAGWKRHTSCSVHECLCDWDGSSSAYTGRSRSRRATTSAVAISWVLHCVRVSGHGLFLPVAANRIVLFGMCVWVAPTNIQVPLAFADQRWGAELLRQDTSPDKETYIQPEWIAIRQLDYRKQSRSLGLLSKLGLFLELLVLSLVVLLVSFEILPLFFLVLALAFSGSAWVQHTGLHLPSMGHRRLTAPGGPRNVIPGAIMFSLFGFFGQTVSNSYDKTDLPASDEPQMNFWQRFASLKWMPVTVLKDGEYEDMLREKQLKLEAEIALVDERIAALKAQHAQALAKDSGCNVSTDESADAVIITFQVNTLSSTPRR
ncbi:hypothetical protein KCU90_g114, partial [Aureobasidium melanogenum]